MKPFEDTLYQLLRVIESTQDKRHNEALFLQYFGLSTSQCILMHVSMHVNAKIHALQAIPTATRD